MTRSESPAMRRLDQTVGVDGRNRWLRGGRIFFAGFEEIAWTGRHCRCGGEQLR